MLELKIFLRRNLYFYILLLPSKKDWNWTIIVEKKIKVFCMLFSIVLNQNLPIYSFINVKYSFINVKIYIPQMLPKTLFYIKSITETLCFIYTIFRTIQNNCLNSHRRIHSIALSQRFILSISVFIHRMLLLFSFYSEWN